MVRRHFLVFLLIALFAISCNMENTAALSEENKALIDSVGKNISESMESEEGKSIPVLLDRLYALASQDLDSALGNGIKAGSITASGSIKGDVSDPLINIDFSFTGLDNLSMISLKTDPETKEISLEVKDSKGNDISDDLGDIFYSEEFEAVVLDALKSGVRIDGKNLALSAACDCRFGEDDLIKSMKIDAGVTFKTPLMLGTFKYSGSINVFLEAGFTPDDEGNSSNLAKLTIKVPFDFDINDGAKDHSISGKLNIVISEDESIQQLTDVRIDGKLVDGAEVLSYISGS